MKRDLKSMKKGTAMPSNEQLSGMDPSVQRLLDRYSGKSEQELIGALMGMSDGERNDMRQFASELAPMLSRAQQQKLAALLQMLDQ